MAGKWGIRQSEIRASEIIKFLRARYGTELTDDDAGREDLFIAVLHLVRVRRRPRWAENFCDLWAPWLPEDKRKALIERCKNSRIKFTADDLAMRFGLARAERERLGIRTIGAVDFDKKQRDLERKEKRRERSRLRMMKRRRRKGVTPRAVYLAACMSTLRPWQEFGISRRTWERRRKAGAPTTCLAVASVFASSKEDNGANTHATVCVPLPFKDKNNFSDLSGTPAR